MWFADHKFMLAAVLLHLALPVAAAVAPASSWRGPALEKTLSKTAEIEVDVSNDRTAEPAPAHLDETPLPERRAPLPERQPAPANPVAEPLAAPADQPPLREPEAVARGAAASPDSFPLPEPGAEPDPMSRPPSEYEVGGPGLGARSGLGGLPLDALLPEHASRHAAPTETTKRTYEVEPARRSIDKAMRIKDAELGLDFPPAAAIAAVLRDAVRGSDAPFECTGSFSVTVSPTGKVSALSLGGFSGGDPATWQLVRKAAFARLSSRNFEMKSSFVSGAQVGVTIRSEHKMPGGGVGRQGASFSFDVADIGAKPVRVVSMSFSAKPLE